MAVLTVDDSCTENLMTVLSLQHVSQSNTDNDWCHIPMSVADTADNFEDNGASIQHNEASGWDCQHGCVVGGSNGIGSVWG